MTTEFVKKRILVHIIQAELATYESCYAPDRAVIPISWLLEWESEVTKYRMRKALKELMADGLIEYTSQGRPAIESCGEYKELVCDAAPPINGYTLTKAGFESDEWKIASEQRDRAYQRWCEGVIG